MSPNIATIPKEDFLKDRSVSFGHSTFFGEAFILTDTPKITLTRCKCQRGWRRALWTSATVPPNWK